MNIHYLTWLLCLLAVSVDAVELTCNNDQAVEVESTVILECTFPGPSTIYYYKPKVSTEIARCLRVGTCINTDGISGYYIALINTTTIHLNITSVQVSDEGVWRCRYIDTSEEGTCNLEVTKTPSCHINSDRNTTELELNEEITFTVNITHYYCSRPFDFLLQTGDTIEELKKNVMVENVTSDIFNSTFNVSYSHIGFLKLLFGCHNKTIPCSGVSTILRKPQSCNITGDLDTAGLKPDETITLSVYIEGYSCFRNFGYLLRTGNVTNNLNGSDNGMYEGNTTILLTDSHFGSVYVDFTCNDVSRNITCRGITSLDVKRETTTATIPTTIITPSSVITQVDPTFYLALGIGTGVGISLVITLVIVGICFLVKRKGTCLKGGVKPSSPDTISADQSEPQTRPVSLVQNGGNEYEMQRRSNYEDLHRNVYTANSYERFTPYETIEHDT